MQSNSVDRFWGNVTRMLYKLNDLAFKKIPFK